MYQITFWALTIGCLLGGFMASMSWLGPKMPFLQGIHNKMIPFQTLIGIVCLAGGILALFFPLGPEMMTGDIIPAVLAILLGFTLAVSYMQGAPGFLKSINNVIRPYQVPLGILAIAAGVIHWFFMGSAPYF